MTDLPAAIRYPLAPNGIFRTIQGEGALLGEPMVFIRLAGCSIGCPLCDTDYRVAERATADAIATRASALRTPTIRYAWITGGEPTDHDLKPLVIALREAGFAVALATAGHRLVPERWSVGGVDWLSVSPHDPAKWAQRRGEELKLVPGLNGFGLQDFARLPARFGHSFVQSCAGKPETVAECQAWVESNLGWKMTVQAHKQWGLA